MEHALVLLLGIATRYPGQMSLQMQAVQITCRPPITLFPPLDEAPCVTCLGAGHVSIPRPLVICDAGARQKSVFGGGTCPPKKRMAGRHGLTTISALPRPLVRGGRGFTPRLRPRRGKRAVVLSVRAGARSPLGTRLGPGSPTWLVVGRPTSCATGCALDALAPPSFRDGSPVCAERKRARIAGSLGKLTEVKRCGRDARLCGVAAG